MIEKWMVHVIWQFLMCRSCIKKDIRIPRRMYIFSLSWAFQYRKRLKARKKKKNRKWNPYFDITAILKEFNVQIWNLQRRCSINVKTLHLWFVDLMISINLATKFQQVSGMVPTSRNESIMVHLSFIEKPTQ